MTYKPSSSGLLAPIQSWLEDPKVTEILLNKPQEIFVEKAGFMKRYVIPKYDIITLNRLFQLIANENQQELSAKKPMLSGSLLDGSRVQLVLPPVARYHCFSIRRKVVNKKSLNEYQAEKFYNHTLPFALKKKDIDSLSHLEKSLLQLYHKKQWNNFIHTAIQLRKNIIISGGTSTGKTTFLNACLQEIPKEERLLILEDTREVELLHSNRVQLLASKGEQSIAKIGVEELLQCSLQVHADRMIVCEIRGKEILDFISACTTGHEGSLTSIHANNPRVAFMRMTQMYKLNHVPAMTDQDIYRELHEVVDIILQLAKTTNGRHLESVYYKHALGMG